MLYCFSTSGYQSIVWHVSHKGTNTPNCGRSGNEPCKDIEDIIEKLQDHDVIFIDGEGTDQLPFSLCANQFIAKSFSIIGHNGKASLECQKPRSDAAILKLTSTFHKLLFDIYHHDQGVPPDSVRVHA